MKNLTMMTDAEVEKYAEAHAVEAGDAQRELQRRTFVVNREELIAHLHNWGDAPVTKADVDILVGMMMNVAHSWHLIPHLAPSTTP